MKAQSYVKILLVFSVFLIVLGAILGRCSNKKISQLRDANLISEGRYSVHEQNEAKLIDSMKRVDLDYKKIILHKDSLLKVYTAKVLNRDVIIDKYKRREAGLTALSDNENMNYFLQRVGSDNKVEVVSVDPDTAFKVLVSDIRYANSIFINRDNLEEINLNYQSSEAALLKVNADLSRQVINRENALTNCNLRMVEKDAMLIEVKKQSDNKDKMLKKTNRKHRLHKIGIGAAGIIAVIITAAL